MTFKEADEILEILFQEEKDIAKTKAVEYTQGDRLDNFKRIGREIGIPAKVVLWIYLKKHLDSIASYIKSGTTLSESIESRILDARVYLHLLRCIIEEDKRPQ